LTLAEPVIDLLADKGYDNKMGARPLGRKIDELIRVPLSKRILFDRLENCTVHAVMNADAIEFVTEEAMPQPVVNDEGYIVFDDVDPSI
jgi:ATP-dependent Clp protease ATP-binding subunit ClpA